MSEKKKMKCRNQRVENESEQMIERERKIESVS